MGTPRDPEQCDVVWLRDADGAWREFMVMFVDREVVACQSFSRNAVFTRDEFERLFEGES